MRGVSVSQRCVLSTEGAANPTYNKKHDLKAELRSIETDLIKMGLLKKDWGQLFNYLGGGHLKWFSDLEPRN